jgi:2'-5' RNA ligase
MLYVLAYPRFAASDVAIIENFRVEFEPKRAAMVPPHFTLMFGTLTLSEGEIAQVASQIAPTVQRFGIVFSGREKAHDPFDNTEKLFLLPTVGGKHIVEIHDALYSQLPTEELNPGFPYVPHMTIATSQDETVAQAALAASARIPLPMNAAVESLTVIEIIDSRLRTVGEFPLRQ